LRERERQRVHEHEWGGGGEGRGRGRGGFPIGRGAFHGAPSRNPMIMT